MDTETLQAAFMDEQKTFKRYVQGLIIQVRMSFWFWIRRFSQRRIDSLKKELFFDYSTLEFLQPKLSPSKDFDPS